MPADSIFDGPVTSLLSILWILIAVISRAHTKGGGGGGGLKLMVSNLALLLVVLQVMVQQAWQ